MILAAGMLLCGRFASKMSGVCSTTPVSATTYSIRTYTLLLVHKTFTHIVSLAQATNNNTRRLLSSACCCLVEEFLFALSCLVSHHRLQTWNCVRSNFPPPPTSRTTPAQQQRQQCPCRFFNPRGYIMHCYIHDAFKLSRKLLLIILIRHM